MTDTSTAASTFALVVTAADLSTLTGHHQFTAYIEETLPDGEIVRGISTVHGIEYTALQSRFAGDPEQWRVWVKEQMLKQYKATRAVHMEVLKWSGQKF